MAAKRNNADREIDLHGYTSSEARARLNTLWSTREWQGLQRVRVIHGTGSVLHALVKLWCEEKGIEWTVEAHNPGVTVLHPGKRLQAISSPPHRPLHPLKHHRPAAKKRDVIAPLPDPDDALTDEERMAREFDRLGEAETQAILRNKRSQESGPWVEQRVPQLQPAKPGDKTEPEPALLTSDPMAEEFERLSGDDALTLFKRKRDLMPQRAAPASAQRDRTTSHHAALRPPPSEDLMAQEFERLRAELPGITRSRKRE